AISLRKQLAEGQMWPGGETVGPDNQKADPFSRIRPESVDDLHCFCFYRDFSSFFCPTVNPQIQGSQ
ncbi:MAG TPA: hypothetical protein VIN33_11945, partial [Marinobacter sp.]